MSEETEIRIYWQGELMCPNPMKTYQHTRSFESMLAEHALLHCGEVSEEDFELIRIRNQGLPVWAFTALLMIPIQLFIVVYVWKGLR